MPDYSKCWKCEGVAKLWNPNTEEEHYECVVCGCWDHTHKWRAIHDRIAAEREKCAKICEDWLVDDADHNEIVTSCAARIREG
jgi:hypothetical protein